MVKRPACYLNSPTNTKSRRTLMIDDSLHNFPLLWDWKNKVYSPEILVISARFVKCSFLNSFFSSTPKTTPLIFYLSLNYKLLQWSRSKSTAQGSLNSTSVLLFIHIDHCIQSMNCSTHREVDYTRSVHASTRSHNKTTASFSISNREKSTYDSTSTWINTVLAVTHAQIVHTDEKPYSNK